MTDQKDKITSSATQNLINGCIAQNRRSEKQLFNQYKNFVLATVHRHLGPGFDIDDVVQQVFISLFKSLSNFKGLSTLNTWVYRITVRVCTDQLRKKYKKRKLEITNNLNEDIYNEISGSTPHSKLEEKEYRIEVYKALNKLSKEKRTVTIMYEIDGASLEDIAEVINKPIGTVKSRLFHARKELQKHLAAYLNNL